LDAILVRGNDYEIDGNEGSWEVAHKLSDAVTRNGAFTWLLLLSARSYTEGGGENLALQYCSRLGLSAKLY
jgi:hypothetical protein